MYRILIFINFFLMASMASAQSVNIDFEALANTSTPLSEDGFTITSNSPDNRVFDSGMGVVTNGTNIFGWCANDCGPVQTINISEDTAQVFTLVSFESANLDFGSIQAGQTIDVVGNLFGGGTVSQSFTLVEDTYTTFTMNSNFTNLTSIDISSNPTSCPSGICDVGIDNVSIVVDAAAPQAISVPTLSSWALIIMILTLGLLATLHFRKEKL